MEKVSNQEYVGLEGVVWYFGSHELREFSVTPLLGGSIPPYVPAGVHRGDAVIDIIELNLVFAPWSERNDLLSVLSHMSEFGVRMRWAREQGLSLHHHVGANAFPVGHAVSF